MAAPWNRPPSQDRDLAGRRVLITGAARGIGSLLAERLSDRGARVALLGLEPEELEAVSARCRQAPWLECDVTDRDRVETCVAEAVERLGGLDVAIANAGIGAQMPLIGGDASVWDAQLAVNLAGSFNLVRAAGPHVSHPDGYFLLTASLAAAVHLPLMSAYCASKAAVESLGDSLRVELRPSGARVGVAYYAELDTEMTSRGFATKAATLMPLGGHGHLPVSPVGPAIDALERGIARRSRRIVSPRWVGPALTFRGVARRRLLLKRSADGGKTWGRAVMLDAFDSHCPRLSRLPDGGGVAGKSVLALLHDAGPVLYWSADDGLTWVRQAPEGLAHGLLDRIIALDGDEATPGAGELLFTAGHLHRGTQPQPRIRQAPTEQLAYISRSRGRRWEAHSVIASEKCLVLCEASVIRLPRPKGDTNPAPLLLALMRENSFVGEPMYYCLSHNGGATWSQPRPTPLIGHRPTLGLTRSGKLLVTYRCVGPDSGTKAWLGTVDELCSDFRVHGLHPDPHNPRLIPEGLLMQTAGGPHAPVRYALRPLTDPDSATASLEAEVLVRESDLNGCGLHLGLWWKLYHDCLVPDCDVDADGAPVLPVEYAPGVFHTLRVDYEPGLCRLFVDGEPRGAYPVDRMSGDTRPILAGSIARKDDNACEAVWRALSLRIREPRLGRDYDWSWSHTSGEMPDAWIDSRVLELQNDRQASPADFGYSGWVELPTTTGKAGGRGRKGGRFFCAYHHGGGTEPGYKPGESAHVAGTWFDEKDFPK